MIDNKLEKIFRKFYKKKTNNIENLNFNNIKNWDSLKHINFMFEVEKSYSIKININEFSNVKSLNEVHKILKKNLKRKSKT